MASPMVEGRVDPHKKAHFSLHLSDRITQDDAPRGRYSSFKYNHKPAQTASTRTTTLTSTSASAYSLRLEDKDGGKDKDVFVFRGQRTVPKQSYMLVFDPSSQKATLEPLSSTFTFNLSSKNNRDVSSSHTKIYPRKQKNDVLDTIERDDLFDEGEGDVNDEPDPDNPYDFRHFLSKGGDREKRGDGSDDNFASSPDYRGGTGSAMNTPQLPARKPAPAPSKPKATQAQPKPRKRKSPEADALVSKKSGTKRNQEPPTVRLERRASTHPKLDATRKSTTSKAAAPPASKIKSSEIVHSSDDSDIDADGDADGEAEATSSPPLTHHSPQRNRQQHQSDPESDEDEDAFGGGGLEIEVPDARPQNQRHSALKSLGLGQNLGLGYLKSPSNGPISLASATNSVEGSPNPHSFTPRKNRTRTDLDDDGVIDFGDIGGGRRGDDSEEEEEGGYADEEEVDDRDIVPISIGSPAQTQQNSAAQPSRKLSVGGAAAEEDEEDPLFKEMMEGLAGGESSEESEEE